MKSAPDYFGPAHAKLFEKLDYKFGDQAAVQPKEPAAVYFDRMERARMLYRVKRSDLKTLPDVKRYWQAEVEAVAEILPDDAEPADVVTVPKPRTLADYRTAVTLGQRSGKPVQYN